MFSNLLQKYLKFWAVKYLSRTTPKIVAVTGSVGKTSAKEAIFLVVKNKFSNARKSEGNLNTETGVPLAILDYKKSPEIFWQWLPIIFTAPIRSSKLAKSDCLVLEMAADKPGDIKYLTSFVKPDISVLTEIGPSHLQAFGTIENIVKEKTQILWALKEDGWAVLNIDNELIKKASFGGRYKKMTYAIKDSADLQAKNITTEIEDFVPATNFEITAEGKSQRISLQTLGLEANIYAYLAAFAVGKILEIPALTIIQSLKTIEPTKHRMNIEKGKSGSIIIDDCYNANPLSMKAALRVLSKLKSNKKYAVLGDMREIGNITDEAHRILGSYAKEVADEVIGVGELAEKYEGHKFFKEKKKAAEYLLGKIRPGDIILIKGSRAIGLEKVVDALKA